MANAPQMITTITALGQNLLRDEAELRAIMDDAFLLDFQAIDFGALSPEDSKTHLERITECIEDFDDVMTNINKSIARLDAYFDKTALTQEVVEAIEMVKANTDYATFKKESMKTYRKWKTKCSEAKARYDQRLAVTAAFASTACSSWRRSTFQRKAT